MARAAAAAARLAAGGLVAVQPGLHDPDFVLLLGDDPLRQVAQFRVLAVHQDGFGHVDGALVVRDHHRDEVVLRHAGGARAPHALVHDGHGVVGQRRVGPVAAGDEIGWCGPAVVVRRRLALVRRGRGCGRTPKHCAEHCGNQMREFHAGFSSCS
jgi:hypothetical protein